LKFQNEAEVNEFFIADWKEIIKGIAFDVLQRSLF